MAIFDRDNKAKDGGFAKSMQTIIEGAINDIVNEKVNPLQGALRQLRDVELPGLKEETSKALSTKAESEDVEATKRSLVEYLKLAAFDEVVSQLRDEMGSGKSALSKEVSQKSKLLSDGLSTLSKDTQKQLELIKGQIQEIKIPSTEEFITLKELEDFKKAINKDLDEALSRQPKGDKTVVRGGSGYAQILNDGVKVRRNNAINFHGTGVTVTENENYTDIEISGGGGSGTSVSKTITQAGHGFAVGKWVYRTTGSYALSDKTTEVTAETIGIVSSVIDVDNFILTTDGYVPGLAGLTDATVYFLDDNGDLTATPTTTDGEIDKPLFVADSTTSGWIINYRGVEIGLPTTPDGDYGDITVSGGGGVWTIDNDVVSFAKMQNITSDRLLGRDTAGTGDVEEISLGTGLAWSGSGSITCSITQYTDELAQDAVGAMVDSTIVYTDGTPLLSRAALTGAITASAGSNTTALGSFTKSQLDTAVSDGNVLFVGDVTQYTDEMAQDAVGAMVNTSLTYVDGTPSLGLTSRTINGTAFDGTGNITVTAAAGTLTGTTLNAAVVTSSLTAVGTLATGNATAIVDAASTTAAGKIEIAIASEVNTGTDATRAVSPDALAGSYAGTKSVNIVCFSPTSDVTTGNGAAYVTIPECCNGMDLIRATATVVTAGTTGASTMQIRNVTQAADMLTGVISIASGGTVATAGTIDTGNDDVATNDVIAVDVDSVSTTKPKGLTIILEFRLP